MARFDIGAPTDIRFGAGRVAELPAALQGLEVRRAFVVTGATAGRADRVRAGLKDAGVDSEVFPVSGEPSVEVVRDGVAALSAGGADGVLGYGGGSALDAAKAIAALAASGTSPLDHLEVVGAGQPLTRPALPWVAVPTTAGTGSEVTRNAVLTANETKASLRSRLLLARIAIVDPDLLKGLPGPVIASGGLDALSQVIEPFLSVRANPFTDAMAREGIQRSARSLRRAWEQGMDADPAVRDDLALTSLFGGLCLANSGLGAAHGFAAGIGARLDAPHGALCGTLLPAAFGVNLDAMRRRDRENPSLDRMAEVAQLLTGGAATSPEAAVDWLNDLKLTLRLPGLAHYGMVESRIPEMVEAGKKASSMRANPITLTNEELGEILLGAL